MAVIYLLVSGRLMHLSLFVMDVLVEKEEAKPQTDIHVTLVLVEMRSGVFSSISLQLLS